jgi:molybdenum cofactor cytidylyltransferase
LTSVLVGIQYAEAAHAPALLVWPVDTPLVQPASVAALLTAWAAGTHAIVRPTHGGAHGHPVIFSSALFGELRAADLQLGARAVVRRDASRVLDVEVSDPGVLRDIDGADEYRTFVERPLD